MLDIADECEGPASVTDLKVQVEKMTPLFLRIKLDQQIVIQMRCSTLYSPARDQFYFWPEGHFRHRLQYMGGNMAVIDEETTRRRCLRRPLKKFHYKKYRILKTRL